MRARTHTHTFLDEYLVLVLHSIPRLSRLLFYFILFKHVVSCLVPRPHLPFEAQLVAGQSHTLSPISCPLQLISSPSNPKNSRGQERHEAMLKFPQRLSRLSIFPSNKNEVNCFNPYILLIHGPISQRK